MSREASLTNVLMCKPSKNLNLWKNVCEHCDAILRKMMVHAYEKIYSKFEVHYLVTEVEII